MRTRTAGGLMAAALALALAVGVGVTSTASAAPDDRARVNARAALGQAKAALHSQSADRPHASDALRQLLMTRDALTGSEANQARAMLSRPSNGVAEFGGAPVWPSHVTQHGRCGENLCVHWVESGTHASTPTYAAQVLAEADHVAQTYIDAGYRPTLPDEGQGSEAVANNMPDIYLANIGADGLYGYCTSDAERPVDGLAYYAFCVLDNNFSATEFPTNTPLGNMKVTAAHEYFHAVQYAYDAWDDTWIYEATATWAEDEVYDDVNDNWYYLPTGQMGDPAASTELTSEGPGVSLDLGDFAYGNWIFFRYLSENLTQSQGGMPTVVRDIWRRLDSTNGKAPGYSLQALSKELAARGTSMAQQYSDFALKNNTPAATYAEGKNYLTTPAHAFGPVKLSKTKKSVVRTVTLDHLTSGTGAFLPFAKGWDAKVVVDMTPTNRGSRAAVAVYRRSGEVVRSWIKLNREGNGGKRVVFDSSKVLGVEVTLVNASTAMKLCGTDLDLWRYSCGGFGRYENQRQKITVTAVN